MMLIEVVQFEYNERTGSERSQGLLVALDGIVLYFHKHEQTALCSHYLWKDTFLRNMIPYSKGCATSHGSSASINKFIVLSQNWNRLTTNERTCALLISMRVLTTRRNLSCEDMENLSGHVFHKMKPELLGFLMYWNNTPPEASVAYHDDQRVHRPKALLDYHVLISTSQSIFTSSNVSVNGIEFLFGWKDI
jgi:hypothetical protein